MNKTVEFKNGTIIDIWEQFSQFMYVKKFNWCTFQLFNFEIEYDRMMGGIEIILIMFGFGLRMRFPIKTDKSEKEWAKIRKSMKGIKDSFYGWGLKDCLKDFKKKEKDYIHIFRTRLIARKEAKIKKTTVKKLFIQ